MSMYQLGIVKRNIVRAEFADFCECQQLTPDVLAKCWGVSETRAANILAGRQSYLAQWHTEILPAELLPMWEARRRTYAVKIAAAVAAVEG